MHLAPGTIAPPHGTVHPAPHQEPGTDHFSLHLPPNLHDQYGWRMKTRLAGLALVLIGVLFAYFFVYLPVRDGPDGFMGPTRLNGLVFIPLAVVTGLAFAIGGPPVLGAFQARPKTKGQLTLVLSIIIGSGILSGIGYWQLKTKWLRPEKPVILDASPKVPPKVENMRVQP
jgi:hypothetical protein